MVAAARQHGLAVVAWTVNAPADLRRMMELGMDAIITDYPARALAAPGRADAEAAIRSLTRRSCSC